MNNASDTYLSGIFQICSHYDIVIGDNTADGSLLYVNVALMNVCSLPLLVLNDMPPRNEVSIRLLQQCEEIGVKQMEAYNFVTRKHRLPCRLQSSKLILGSDASTRIAMSSRVTLPISCNPDILQKSLMITAVISKVTETKASRHEMLRHTRSLDT